MATVGIMHSGSSATNRGNVQVILDRLSNDCVNPPVIYGNKCQYAGDPGTGTIQQIANRLVSDKVDLIIAAGGSESAQAAIKARHNNQPTIVFTSVAPYVANNPPANAGGVCAHTSDHDVARLNWLLAMPLKGTRIGVLRNSARGDQNNQMGLLNGGAAGKCVLNHKDINTNKSLQDLFNEFRGHIDALLVAADPFFNNNAQEVVNRANGDRYPAIFQWCEFVGLGGLMSYGPILSQCYDHAGAIAVQILNGTVNPPYPIWAPNDPNDFELCVSQARAMALNMWPLPSAIINSPQYKPKP